MPKSNRKFFRPLRSHTPSGIESEEKYRIRVLRLNTFDLIEESKYSPVQLATILLYEDSPDWERIMRLKNDSGVRLSFEVGEITDRRKFVQSYLRARYGDKKWKVKDSRTKKRHKTKRSLRVDHEKGKADFEVHWTGEAGKSEYKEDKIFVEYKSTNDSLGSSQIAWLLNAVNDGYECWVMWVEELES